MSLYRATTTIESPPRNDCVLIEPLIRNGITVLDAFYLEKAIHSFGIQPRKAYSFAPSAAELLHAGRTNAAIRASFFQENQVEVLSTLAEDAKYVLVNPRRVFKTGRNDNRRYVSDRENRIDFCFPAYGFVPRSRFNDEFGLPTLTVLEENAAKLFSDDSNPSYFYYQPKGLVFFARHYERGLGAFSLCTYAPEQADPILGFRKIWRIRASTNGANPALPEPRLNGCQASRS